MHRFSVPRTLLCFPLLASFAAAAPGQSSAAITVDDVRARTWQIAHDSMEGRDTGRPGGLRAAKYIAAELKRLGVTPAGDSGTFFQQIPWVVRTPDSAGTLRVGEAALTWKRDYVLLPRIGFALALGGQPFGASFTGTNVATVYGGRIGDSLIAPDRVRGKAVIFAPSPAQQNIAFWQRDNLRRYADAAAIIVANLDVGAPPAYTAKRETYWDNAPGSTRMMAVLSLSRAAAAQVFGRALDSLSIGDAGKPLSGNVRFIDSSPAAPAYNVVGIIPGSDAARRRTYVSVGAHYDHIGMGPAIDHDSVRAFNMVARKRGADDPNPRSVTPEQLTRINALRDSLRAARGGVLRDSIFNGADDDGSGTALLLEIAEAFARGERPRRSILLIFYTAEERGLFGSLYYSDHPTVPRDSIIANVNMDQMGRGDPHDEPAGGNNALVVIGARRLAAQLGDLVEEVNQRAPYRFTLDYQFDKDGDPTNAYCRSDHYMFARFGIPVTFFSAAAWYIDYHMVSDEPQYIAWERTTRIGNFILDYVRELANLRARPPLTGPKPDPDAICRQ